MNMKARILAVITAISVAVTPICTIQANAGGASGPSMFDALYEESSMDWATAAQIAVMSSSIIRSMEKALTTNPGDIFVVKHYRTSRGTKAAAQKLANKLNNNPYGVFFAVDKANIAGGSFWLTPGFKSKSFAAQCVKRINKVSTGWKYSFDRKSGLYLVYCIRF